MVEGIFEKLMVPSYMVSKKLEVSTVLSIRCYISIQYSGSWVSFNLTYGG